MSALIEQTVADLKAGRETWRVITLVAVPSFFVAVSVVLIHVH